MSSKNDLINNGFQLFIGGGLFTGILRAIGILLWISGILSFIAFFGLVIGSELLNFTTIISGLLTLPMGILVMILGLRLKRGGIKHG